MEYENLINTIKDIGEEIVKKYKSELKNKNKIASGKLYNSIDYKLEVTSNSIKLIFISEDYFINVEDGRPAGKRMPPIDVIKKWCKQKGILEKNAYAIARNISLKGIRKVPSLKESRNVSRYTELIKKAIDKDIAGINK